MPLLQFRLSALAAFAGLAFGQAQSSAPLTERGMASWYGGPFEGQKAASGEIYHQEQLTAAHRTLAFGTKVRVRRLDSGQSVVVRINDRGPYVPSRIIDLSYAAARGLGMTEPGLIAVAVEVLPPAETRESLPFAVQAGTFRDPANARRAQAVMEQKFGVARIVPVRGEIELYSVLVGAAATQADAELLAAKVRSINKAYESAYVVHVEASLESASMLSF